MTSAREVVVAVDGGGSKTDVVAVTRDGQLVAHARGAGCSPHFIGLDASVATVDELVREVAADATVVQASLYLSGLDLPVELEQYGAALADVPWARTVTVDNDLFALLRAGSDAPDAVVVVCGTGINALGRRADGEVARFAALGTISGDWGGGYGLGSEALWHAARAVDGRGPETALVTAVCAALDVPSITALTEQLHFGQREHTDLSRLAPVVFEAAADGDAVAVALVERQAEEIVAYVRATAQRLRLGGAFDVVLGGGILRADLPALHALVADGILASAPSATISTVREAPVVGAGMLALEQAGAGPTALARARASLAALSR